MERAGARSVKQHSTSMSHAPAALVEKQIQHKDVAASASSGPLSSTIIRPPNQPAPTTPFFSVTFPSCLSQSYS